MRLATQDPINTLCLAFKREAKRLLAVGFAHTPQERRFLVRTARGRIGRSDRLSVFQSSNGSVQARLEGGCGIFLFADA